MIYIGKHIRNFLENYIWIRTIRLWHTKANNDKILQAWFTFLLYQHKMGLTCTFRAGPCGQWWIGVLYKAFSTFAVIHSCQRSCATAKGPGGVVVNKPNGRVHPLQGYVLLSLKANQWREVRGSKNPLISITLPFQYLSTSLYKLRNKWKI